jgi:hypothetical protein
MQQINITKEHLDSLKKLTQMTGGASIDKLVGIAISALIEGAENGALDHLINQDGD